MDKRMTFVSVMADGRVQSWDRRFARRLNLGAVPVGDRCRSRGHLEGGLGHRRGWRCLFTVRFKLTCAHQEKRLGGRDGRRGRIPDQWRFLRKAPPSRRRTQLTGRRVALL